MSSLLTFKVQHCSCPINTKEQWNCLTFLREGQNTVKYCCGSIFVWWNGNGIDKASYTYEDNALDIRKAR